MKLQSTSFGCAIFCCLLTGCTSSRINQIDAATGDVRSPEWITEAKAQAVLCLMAGFTSFDLNDRVRYEEFLKPVSHLNLDHFYPIILAPDMSAADNILLLQRLWQVSDRIVVVSSSTAPARISGAANVCEIACSDIDGIRLEITVRESDSSGGISFLFTFEAVGEKPLLKSIAVTGISDY